MVGTEDDRTISMLFIYSFRCVSIHTPSPPPISCFLFSCVFLLAQRKGSGGPVHGAVALAFLAAAAFLGREGAPALGP